MRIALVNPISQRNQGYHTVGSFIPQLGLQVLSDLTPAGHQVDIVDEIFGTEYTDTMLTRDRYDLVGITAYTSGATRTYEIAAQCREQNIPTIMGGPHASACPDEVSAHVDSVAIGECDRIWPQIVEDAANKRLKRRYQGDLPDLEDGGYGRATQDQQPINGKYDVAAIQTSRGCPVGCEYCSVTRFNGAPIRRRRQEDIIKEWNETPKNFIFVVDDNFFGVGEKHAIWAKELLRRIIKEGKKRLWFSQTTINMGDDPEGLKLAYKAGCRGMLVGFETFNKASLKDYSKGINRKNVDRYKDLIGGFHKAGIAVFGGFIIGSDQDDQDTAAETLLHAVKLGIDIIQVTNLTPLPGTNLYDQYLSDGRLRCMDYPNDWERYTFTETVYHPKQMTARELDEAIYEVRHAAAKQPWVVKRALRTLVKTRSLTTAAFVYGMNQGWKRIAKAQAPRDAERFGFTPERSTDRWRKVLDSFRMHLRGVGV